MSAQTTKADPLKLPPKTIYLVRRHPGTDDEFFEAVEDFQGFDLEKDEKVVVGVYDLQETFTTWRANCVEMQSQTKPKKRKK